MIAACLITQWSTEDLKRAQLEDCQGDCDQDYLLNNFRAFCRCYVADECLLGVIAGVVTVCQELLSKGCHRCCVWG